MSGLYKVQHAFHGSNGTSRDDYVNVFWIFSNRNWDEDLGGGFNFAHALADYVKGFYGGIDSNSQTISQYLSQRVMGGRTVKVYQAAEGPPGGPNDETGPPVYTETEVPTVFPHADPAAQSLPEECAVCLSYTAVTTGSTRARRRGRIYIGPLNVGAMDPLNTGDQPVVVSDAFVGCLLLQGLALKNALLNAEATWVQHSFVNQEHHEIVQVSVDNVFDTIRGRGNQLAQRATQNV